MMKKVLITGVTGQDGAFLAKQLVEDGVEVYGAVRRGSTPKTGRLRELNILDKVNFIGLELTEFANVLKVVADLRPDAIYNLAAQSFVADSFQHPHLTTSINYLGVLNILESVKTAGIDCNIYQASTSEMYGDVLEDPQSEKTPFNPMSPYAVAKAAAHHLVVNYRVAYGMNASNGILFNHESELRGREFVTRKISSQIAELAVGGNSAIQLGNLDSVRDWGYAPEYVAGMRLINESSVADDFVIATNQVKTVRDFLSYAAVVAGFDPIFEGQGINEKCLCRKSNRVIAEVNKRFFRPSDVAYLRGDYTKINEVLGWSPETSVEKMVEIMVNADLNRLKARSGSWDV